MIIDGLPIEEWRAKLHSPEVTARFLHMKPSTLAFWRCRKSDGPRYRKIGARVVYLGADLIDWVDAQARKSTSDLPVAA